MSLPLIALAVASFGIGTTEFVIMGLLPEVAADLGVSIPSAGMLVSGYALGVVVGAPILAMLTARLPRKAALLTLMAMFVLGNLLCAVAPSYWLLMGARVLTAFCHGTFFGIGSVVAANLVAPNRRAQAVALMFAGLTLANVLGVPLGTALGQVAGWRATFWCVVAIGLAALLAIALLVPRQRTERPVSLLQECRVLGRPQVLLAMAISVVASASLFSVFTYITPILRDVTGVSPQGVTGVLLLFGVGLTLGNLAGGRLADWKLMPALVAIFALLTLIVSAFSLTSQSFVPAVVTVFVWGVAVFAVVPPLQIRVVNEANEAPNLASILNQGAFNLGNAAGAWIGGVVIEQGMSYQSIPLVGGGLAFVALLLTLASRHLEGRTAATAHRAGGGVLKDAA
ncbi:MFS transporter [Azospirillum sp. SYSU D00513]|uniref:MFS transporter n=1 Tax=Azospirillum sp. SYSU D00513 TaxID=2812561 RepID=UPI001A96FC53|nr:MFS transporter [Azospirillum sp. SYSU D00513]